MRRLLLALPLMLSIHSQASSADLRAGFAAAVELNAEIRTLTAQRDIIAARRRGSETLLPAAPTLAPSWRTQVNRKRAPLTALRRVELIG